MFSEEAIMLSRLPAFALKGSLVPFPPKMSLKRNKYRFKSSEPSEFANELR